MRPSLTALTLSAAVLAGAVVPTAATAAAPDEGATPDGPVCERRAGELKRWFGGAVWVRDGALFGCTPSYADEPVTRRLGRWRAGSRIVFDGRHATWTTRSGRRGDVRDRITTVDVGSGAARYRDVLPVPGDPGDDRIAALQAGHYGVAWVTTRGTLVMSVTNSRRAPVALGAGSAAGGGLQTPLRPDGLRLVVGRWPGAAHAAARTLEIDSLGAGGDFCGGISSPEATVRPEPGAPRVGARWDLTFANARRGC